MITAIIPTYNRARLLLNALVALRDQTPPDGGYKVIVVDDASCDDTECVVRSFVAQHALHQWQYLRQAKNSGKSGALNTAICAASSPLIAFTDDDVVPCRDWLAAHAARHRRETGLVAAVGKISYPDDWIARSNLIRYHNSRYLGHNRNTACALRGMPLRPSTFSGGNASVPRTALIEAGLFDLDLRRGQDCELGLRLHKTGMRLVYEPNAAVVHFAEAAWSYRSWLTVFQKFYLECAPTVIEMHGDLYRKYCHWFVEPVQPFRESLKSTLVKTLCRALARPRLGKWLAQVMETHDSNPLFYRPLVYEYIVLCAAIEAVNRRGKSARGPALPLARDDAMRCGKSNSTRSESGPSARRDSRENQSNIDGMPSS